MKVGIKLVDGGKIPEYKTEGSACADCYARLPTESIILIKGERTLINLGFCLELPEGIEAVIRPRSGLSKDGIDVAIGTIDWDYKLEVKCQIINNSKEDFTVHNLDRICQIKFQRASQVIFEEVHELSETNRTGGFGSTDIRG